MSFDLNLPTVCNHKIYKELTSLGTDLRSLRLSKPMSSTMNIQVYASEDMVPKVEYSVVDDSEAIDVNRPRMIYFKDKWSTVEDFFEVTYVTLRSFCPRCIGLKVLDDISYDVRGALINVRDEKLLLQNLEKFTVTEVESNPFHNFIGTSLISLIGEKIIDVNFLTTKIIQEINATLEKLRDLQVQYKATGRDVTDGELLETIENVEVKIDEEDPTVLRADVTVTAKSGKSVDFVQYLKIPEG